MSESPDDFDDKGNLIGLDDAREPEASAEPAVEPVAEPEPEPAEEAPETEPEAEPEPVTAETEEEEEPAPRDTRKDWRDRQIIKAREAAKKERELREAAETRANALEALYGQPGEEQAEGRAVITREEAKKEALAEFRQEQYYKNLNTAAETMFEAGQKAFPKSWGTRVAQAAEVFRDEIIGRPEFLEVVTGLDNAPAVYHALAGDPDKMEAILAMPSAKMGAELAKMSINLAKAPPVNVSRAPAPIKPLDKPTIEDLPLDDPNLSQEEFNRRMDAAEAKKYGTR